MNSLIFLSSDDFSIQSGKKGNILCNKIPGISFVLFYSNQCPHCGGVVDQFKTLPQLLPNCQFGMVNVSTNKDVALMSQKTISPITYVPFIILFVNGRPFIVYNGQKTATEMAGFVYEVISRIQQKKNFITSKSNGDEEHIEYVGGVIPFNVVCEGEQCYLSFSDAYKK
jgi:hypothetical protein